MNHCSRHPGWSPNGEPVVTCEAAGHVPANDPTADGVTITVGLRVFTNDLKLGTVTALGADGWHDVESDLPGYSGSFNGERLTTRNPFTHEVAR